MASWVNRTVLSGASTAANGGTTHTCTFTAAASGNYLLAFVTGSVTFTTPTGWTLIQSAVNFSGLYAFGKVASAGEASFSSTHNGSNYAILGVVYEFYAGTVYNTGNAKVSQAFNATEASPLVSGLTGTYSRFSARSVSLTGSSTSSATWTIPSVSDYDSYVLAAANPGVGLTIATDDNNTASSFTASSNLANSGTPSGEGVALGLNVVSGPTINGSAPLAWIIGQP